MTLSEAKKEFRKTYPNIRVNGWDERDYSLWSAVQQLPSYGIVFTSSRGDDVMVSRNSVIELIKKAAEARLERGWREKHGPR